MHGPPDPEMRNRPAANGTADRREPMSSTTIAKPSRDSPRCCKALRRWSFRFSCWPTASRSQRPWPLVGSVGLRELAIMNAHDKTAAAVSRAGRHRSEDPRDAPACWAAIHVTRANWLISEATILGKALKSGEMTSRRLTPS